MEFCAYDNLYLLLHMEKKESLCKWGNNLGYSISILLGLEYLHSQHIFNRDIILSNIFISKNRAFKIGDMGMSKKLSSK